MRLVENQEWAAVLLAQPCALLMAALWAVVPVGSHTESLNAAMVSFQYGRGVAALDAPSGLWIRLSAGRAFDGWRLSTYLNVAQYIVV